MKISCFNLDGKNEESLDGETHLQQFPEEMQMKEQQA